MCAMVTLAVNFLQDMFIGWLNPAATGAGVMHHAASEQQSGAHDTTAAGSVTPGSKQQPGGSTTSAPSPAPPALAFSWLIAAGKNAAYDAFPCQHQLFSRGKNKGVLWYEPVFKVRGQWMGVCVLKACWSRSSMWCYVSSADLFLCDELCLYVASILFNLSMFILVLHVVYALSH